MKIIIVDDSKFALNRLEKEILKINEKAEIISSTSGKEAIELVEKIQDEIEFVFIDFNMPDMNGIDLARKLVKKIPFERMVMLSANASFVTGEQEVPQGMRYIKKPITQKSLNDLFNFEASSSKEELPQKIEVKLIELFMSGVQDAVSEFSNILEIKEDFELTVPKIDSLTFEEIKNRYINPVKEFNLVRVQFTAPENGYVFMIFSTQITHEILNILKLSSEVDREKEEDTFKEIGNIMMNSCLVPLCSQLKIDIIPGLPEYFKFNKFEQTNHILNILNDEKYLYFCVRFVSRSVSINGGIGLLLRSDLILNKLNLKVA